MKFIVIIGIVLLVLLTCFFANMARSGKEDTTKYVVAFYVCLVSIIGLCVSLTYM